MQEYHRWKRLLHRIAGTVVPKSHLNQDSWNDQSDHILPYKLAWLPPSLWDPALLHRTIHLLSVTLFGIVLVDRNLFCYLRCTHGNGDLDGCHWYNRLYTKLIFPWNWLIRGISSFSAIAICSLLKPRCCSDCLTRSVTASRVKFCLWTDPSTPLTPKVVTPRLRNASNSASRCVAAFEAVSFTFVAVSCNTPIRCRELYNTLHLSKPVTPSIDKSCKRSAW